MAPKYFIQLICGLLFTSVFIFANAYSQKKRGDKESSEVVKFGEIELSDFDPVLHSFDSTADAIILFDKGVSYFKESKEGWFNLIFERHQRIKVVNKNGMDAANFIIPQYKKGTSEEKIEKLKAITFNVENGQVVQTVLNEKDIYKDQVNKMYNLTKFGMPNIKEGSIIDIAYTINSTFLFNLRSWEFQGKYPRLHTEYTTIIPDFFVYVMLRQGFLPFDDKVEKTKFKTYTVKSGQETTYQSKDVYSIPTNDRETKWTMEKVPALKPEPFTSTIDNYVSKISYQLKEYRFPGADPSPVMSSWTKFGEELLKDDEFGGYFDKNNGWINEEVKNLTTGASTNLEKAKAIYNYWKDKFLLSSSTGKYMTDNPKNVWKNAKGNPADANIVLTLMLRSAGITADPILLSTRDNGFANDDFPLINQYNYVIVRVKIDEKIHYLDATQSFLGFGQLPLECYNGHARIIQSLPMPVYFEANDLKESKTTIVNLFGNNEKPWEGLVESSLGTYESLSLREKVKSDGQKSIEQDIQNALPAEVEMKNLTLENLKDYEQVVKAKYSIDFDNVKEEDIIYLNPLLGERTKENPFAAAERKYPVEMPYAFRETIISNIVVPEGFTIDEMPKQTRVVLDDNQGVFEYLLQEQDGRIQVRCILELKKANFNPERYTVLRDFFTYVVNKQSEQIVFKRKP
jgi:hypothetical protein